MPPLDNIAEHEDAPRAEYRSRSVNRASYANSLAPPGSPDPDLQLRIVRSATESIHEAAKEDERRRVGKRRRATNAFKSSLLGTIRRGGRATQSSAANQQQHEKGFAPPASRDEIDVSRADRASRIYQEEEQSAKAENFVEAKPGEGGQEKGAESRRRRNVHVNVDLSPLELDKYGQPLVRYARNKVRTFKYTIVTFLPRVRFNVYPSLVAYMSLIITTYHRT